MTSSRQKRKTSERFQPAKSDQIFVEAGKVKRQPAKSNASRQNAGNAGSAENPAQSDWLGGNVPYTMTYAHGPH